MRTHLCRTVMKGTNENIYIFKRGEQSPESKVGSKLMCLEKKTKKKR